jgi:RecJ-like exonuclease
MSIGYIYSRRFINDDEIDCRACGGTGRSWEGLQCPYCHGEGSVRPNSPFRDFDLDMFGEAFEYEDTTKDK